MTHDPECPRSGIDVPADYWERDVYFKGCYCALIARVRADEQLPCVGNCEGCYERGYEHGAADERERAAERAAEMVIPAAAVDSTWNVAVRAAAAAAGGDL